MAQLHTTRLFSLLLLALQLAAGFLAVPQPQPSPRSLAIVRGATDWDRLIREDEDEDLVFEYGNRDPPPRDMKYSIYNINRQREHYNSIREVSSKDLSNDVYARDPNTDTYFFVGKIARVSDVTPASAVARQYNLIEEHSARLRPIELYPSWGSIELWLAPGDSELDVAYCKPDIRFIRVDREVDGSIEVPNSSCGFAGELYESNEEGFRTQRTEDGFAAKPEVQTQQRQPSDAEMDELMETLSSKVQSGSS